MALYVQKAKYDKIQAIVDYDKICTSILTQFTEYKSQEAQHKVIEKLLYEANKIGLTGDEYSRESIVKQVINYSVSKSFTPQVNPKFISLPTRRTIAKDSYNRMSQTNPNIPTIAFSASNTKLFLFKNKVSESVGLHICINPTSALQEGSLTKRKDLQESISNDLRAYYGLRKKEKKLLKAGMFRLLETEEQKKYQQIVSFFQEGNSVNCLSFDFFFDGKKFREASQGNNPFNSGYISYLDLSFEYAQITNTDSCTLGNFKQPKYSINRQSFSFTEKLKLENEKIMKWKVHKNLDIFLGLIADSAKVKEFKMISLAGLALTYSDIAALGSIVKKGNVQFLNLQGCSISKNENCSERNGLMQLRDVLSSAKNLCCAILDDLTYYKRKKNSCGKVFEYERLTDQDFSSLIYELRDQGKSLKEIYVNWNKELHVKTKFIISKQIVKGSDEYELLQNTINKNQGTLGEKSYDMLYSMVFHKHLQVYEAKNNQLPFDLVQNFAIALYTSHDVLQFTLSGNVDQQLLHDPHCCLTCCYGIFSCCHFLSCCFDCFKVEDFNDRPISKEVEDKLLFICNQNRNKEIREPYYLAEEKKYLDYKVELDKKEEQARLLRLLEEKRRLERIEAEKKAQEEEKEREHQKKLELAKGGAAKTLTNVQNHYDSSIAHIGDNVKTQKSIKAIEAIPYKINQKNNKLSEIEDDSDLEQLKKSKISKKQKKEQSSSEDEEEEKDDDNNKKPKLSKKKSKKNSKKQMDEEQSSQSEESSKEISQKQQQNNQSLVQNSQEQNSQVKSAQEQKQNQSENTRAEIEKQKQPETKYPDEQKQNLDQQKIIDDEERAKLIDENNIVVKQKPEKDGVVNQIIMLE